MTSTSASILDEVLCERMRQINRHGYTEVHDDEHSNGQICRAALNYIAAASVGTVLGRKRATIAPPLDGKGLAFDWPWERRYWKPGLVRRMLIKGMALTCAEVERIDRAETRRG